MFLSLWVQDCSKWRRRGAHNSSLARISCCVFTVSKAETATKTKQSIAWLFHARPQNSHLNVLLGGSKVWTLEQQITTIKAINHQNHALLGVPLGLTVHHMTHDMMTSSDVSTSQGYTESSACRLALLRTFRWLRCSAWQEGTPNSPCIKHHQSPTWHPQEFLLKALQQVKSTSPYFTDFGHGGP